MAEINCFERQYAEVAKLACQSTQPAKQWSCVGNFKSFIFKRTKKKIDDKLAAEIAADKRPEPDSNQSSSTSLLQEEMKFRERSQAETAFKGCLQKEVESDFAMNYGVLTAINTALDSCAALLEKYALADCVGGIILPGDTKEIADARHQRSCVQSKRRELTETWMPVLLKRRVELQPDGPKHLYDFASRFVYAVVATNDNTTLQGSAVAIDDRHLATNCHVIEKATRITIYSGNTKLGAERFVPRWSLPGDKGGPDRCLLYASEQLPAFAMVRAWSTLSVGERLFAIGVPQDFALALSLTFSDGMLSGKRTDGKHRLIQTTAPISQGSSGGGLFDSSGRLLGITSFALSTGQTLNFAIAAEDWNYELCSARGAFPFASGPDCAHHKPVPYPRR